MTDSEKFCQEAIEALEKCQAAMLTEGAAAGAGSKATAYCEAMPLGNDAMNNLVELKAMLGAIGAMS